MQITTKYLLVMVKIPPKKMDNSKLSEDVEQKELFFIAVVMQNVTAILEESLAVTKVNIVLSYDSSTVLLIYQN